MVRPSIWLSEEWFNPDGVNGFAIPFYLAHPRLIRLERKLMLEAEGVAEKECLRILRHETGHAIDEAFQLYRTPNYRRVFGSPRQSYPTSYAVRPRSREHVLHLNAWYAQAHPVEDFAETFAVWLRPKRLWRRQYRDWPALEKLEAVDRWMADCAGRPPVLKARRPVAELAESRRTLAEHYDEKRAFYGVGNTTGFDATLRQIFPNPAATDRDSPRKSAVGILRAIRTPLRKEVARPLGVRAYAVDQVLRQLIQRARALDLRHTRSTDATIEDLVRFVSRTTIDLIKNSPRLPL
jgi:Putative zinc-binding metallo-peptidase